MHIKKMKFDSIKGIRKGIINLGISKHIQKNKDYKEMEESENFLRLQRMGFDEKEYFNNRY